MCRGESHFFFKWPLANVGESGESVTAFWQIWRILKLGRFYVQKKIFLGIKLSSLPSPNLPNSPNSQNLQNSLNTCPIWWRDWQKFGGSLVFANLSTRQKQPIFGEYSNLLNLPASGHCLIHIQLRRAAMGQSPSGLWCTCVHAKQLQRDPMSMWGEKIIKYSLFLRQCKVQWKPLNVITDNVIIRLMLSHSKSPVLFVQISNKKIHLLW